MGHAVGYSPPSPGANPSLPAGRNSASFYASVLNTKLNPATPTALPAGQNSASFYASVLNTAFNPAANPPLPTGRNAANFYASVLNTAFNPVTNPPLPKGQNSASFYISVCNRNSGCTAAAPMVVSANASQESTRPLPPHSPQISTGGNSLPALEPVEDIASLTVGQTIRMVAQNVDPGSIVEFDVNRTAIATVADAPYETLFTVPDGVSDLLFQIIVRTPGSAERVSRVSRITVVQDSGANVFGSVTPTANGQELSLEAGGLRADYFRLAQPITALPSLESLKPVRSGYVTAVNEPNPAAAFGDDPLGAHLGFDYAVRFSGEVRADQAGSYRFWLKARSGAFLRIDGKPVAASGFASGPPSETEASVALEGGWHAIEVIYYLAVGESSIELDWQQPGSGRRAVLGPEYLRTALEGLTTTLAPDGTFAFTQVPQKFDAVWIRMKQSDGFIEFQPVKPGAGPLMLAIPK